MTHTEPLTAIDALSIAAIIDLAAEGKRVARANDDGSVIYGTARYLSGQADGPRPDDVRDAFLRVTTRTGMEVWWPMSELINEYRDRLFYDWSAVRA